MKFHFGPNNQFSIDYEIKDFEEFALPKSESENYDLEKVAELVKKIIEKHGWKPEFVVLDEAAKLRERTYYEERKETFDELESELKDGKKLWLCSNLDSCQDFTEDDADCWTDYFQEKICKADDHCDIEAIVQKTFDMELHLMALWAWPE